MATLSKIFWGVRAVLLGRLFGHFGLPGYLGKPTLVLGVRGIHVGRRVRIFPGLRAECHQNGTIRIGDNVSIGQNFHLVAIGPLEIGAGTLISGSVFVTDMDHEYRDTTRPVHEQEYLYARTKIGENCFLGIGSRILAGTILGDGCIVGANSVVRGVYPPHSVIVGIPGRIVKQVEAE
ncbi:MAG: acyltransferase [Aeromicrobium sp.]|uniref:acyltransferase n=1 Tax=Aeromicrobium sp. TaxID=1871063 RepID=UPI0039E2D692